MLQPNDFPFLLKNVLRPLFKPTPLFRQAIEEGGRTGLDPHDGRWLVFDENDVIEGMNQLMKIRDVADGVLSHRPEDTAIEKAADIIDAQVLASVNYLSQGWRAGMYVHWGKPPPFPSWTFKVHLALLWRVPTAPYLLRPRFPVCQLSHLVIPKEWEVMMDQEITCSRCRERYVKQPEGYSIVPPPKVKQS